MKKTYIYFLLISLLTISCKIDNKCKSEVDSLTGKLVYTTVEEKPIYKNGITDVFEFLRKEFIHPDQEQLQYSFNITFIIDKNGNLKAPRIQGKKESQLTNAEKEIIRVIKTMPKWKSGKCGNEKVSVKYSLPIHLSFDK